MKDMDNNTKDMDNNTKDMDNNASNADNDVSNVAINVSYIDPVPDHTASIPELQGTNLVAVRHRRSSYDVEAHQRGGAWVRRFHVNEHEQTYYVKKEDESDGKDDDKKKEDDIHGGSGSRKRKPMLDKEQRALNKQQRMLEQRQRKFIKKPRADRSIFMGGRRPEDSRRAQGFVFPAQGVNFLKKPEKSGSSGKEDEDEDKKGN